MPLDPASLEQLFRPLPGFDADEHWAAYERARAVARGLVLTLGDFPWVEDIAIGGERGEPFVVRVSMSHDAPRSSYAHLLEGTGRIDGIAIRVKRS